MRLMCSLYFIVYMGMEMGTNFHKQCDSNKFDIYDTPVSMKFVSFTIHNGYYNRFSRYSMSPNIRYSS